MKNINEITNVKTVSIPSRETEHRTKVWEEMQLLVLALTIIGQCIVGGFFIIGQSLWCVANTIALIRDFKLQRPYADKVKNATMLAITIGIIVGYLFIV